VPASSSDPISQFFASLAGPGQLAAMAGETVSLRFDVADGDEAVLALGDDPPKPPAVRSWYLTVSDGVISTSADNARPDAVIRVGRGALEDMIGGRLNAHAAILRGVLTCEGSVAALITFQRCLPGPPGSAGRVAPISGATVTAQRGAA
jgi:hypothetical protein